MVFASMPTLRRQPRPFATVHGGGAGTGVRRLSLSFGLVNGYDIGGRTLKVNQADQDVGEQYRTPVTASVGSGTLPPAQLPSGTPSLDTINATLSSMNNAQLVEILSQMKVGRAWGARQSASD